MGNRVDPTAVSVIVEVTAQTVAVQQREAITLTEELEGERPVTPAATGASRVVHIEIDLPFDELRPKEVARAELEEFSYSSVEETPSPSAREESKDAKGSN